MRMLWPECKQVRLVFPRKSLTIKLSGIVFAFECSLGGCGRHLSHLSQLLGGKPLLCASFLAHSSKNFPFWAVGCHGNVAASIATPTQVRHLYSGCGHFSFTPIGGCAAGRRKGTFLVWREAWNCQCDLPGTLQTTRLLSVCLRVCVNLQLVHWQLLLVHFYRRRWANERPVIKLDCKALNGTVLRICRHWFSYPVNKE